MAPRFQTHIPKLIHILWIVLFAYISLVPFYYLQPVSYDLSPQTVTLTKYLPAILIATIALFTLLTSFNNLKLRICNFKFTIPLLLYLAFSLLSLINAAYPTEGLLKFGYYTLTGPTVAIILILHSHSSQFSIENLQPLAHEQSESLKILNSIILISSLVAFYGLLVYLSGHDFIWGHIRMPYHSGAARISSTLGNAVYAGAYFALCLPLAIWAYRHEIRPNHKTALAIALAVLTLGLLLTFTRGGWIAAGLASAIYAYPHLSFITRTLRQHLSLHRLVVGLIFLLTSIAVLEGIGFEASINRVWNTFWQRIDRSSDLSDTESFRLAQYGTTYNVLKQHPFLGVGFGNFTRQFETYKHESTPRGYIANTTENMLLMTACETGLLGLFTFLALLFAILRTLYRAYKSSPNDLLLACIASFCGFLLNMLTWDALNEPTIRITFWLIVGIGIKQDVRSKF